MADFSPSRLSPAGRILLLGLLVVNLLVFVVALTADRQPEIVAERRLPEETDPLRLLDELSDADRKALAPPPNRAVPKATFPDDPPVLVCRAWGPFSNDETLEPARIAVAAVTDQLRVVQGELSTPPDFLVRLDTDNNLDNARRLQKELEGQNIDAYVIAGGPFINSVSAGVFSQRGSAERLAQSLRDLGYSPRLEPLLRNQEVSHLIARVPEGFELDGLRSLPCPEIASQVEFL